MASLVGSRVERKEDKRFLTGKGRYTADINLANQTYAIFIRSPHARAKIKKIDTSKALKASGVVEILTGEDIAKDKIGGLIAGWAIRSEDGSEMKCPPNPPLAKDSVNFVGDPIAVVFAETLDEASAAADLVKVDYKVLKAVASLADTMKSEAIHEGIEKNLCYDWLLGDRQKVKEAFDKADKIIKLDITNNRLIPNAMEPRACVIDYNTASEEITCYTTSQNPHLSRLIMSAFGGVTPENKLRVIAPDVGGGFGSKINLYNEEIVCRAIYGSKAPVISAVGHETDVTLSDLVSDYRAPTPSAAAEVAVPDMQEISEKLYYDFIDIGNITKQYIDLKKHRVNELTRNLKSYVPNFDSLRQRLDELTQQSGKTLIHKNDVMKEILNAMKSRLQALNPENVLSRGYSILQKSRDSTIVFSKKQVQGNEDLVVTLKDGKLEVKSK